ncbi:MAG: siphovirus Gp157 family protein [Gammaproteobacteria bacterium]|nr:siphovirus Gp157 family protein [Gammaproteobacteria bacterium]
MSLYEISTEYQEAFNTLQEMGLDADDIADSLAAIQGEFEDKAINCIKWEKGIGGKIDAIDAEIKRLQVRKKAITNQRDSFREYIRSSMEATGINKIESDLFTITLKKAAKVVSIWDFGDLPPEYCISETVRTADKLKIKQDLQADIDVKGAKLVDGKRGLLIK